MPAYTNSPFAPAPKLMTAGWPETLIGTAINYDQPYGTFAVTSDAISSNVATVTVVTKAGRIPAVGDLISIQGTANSGGAFNVNRVAITAVSITLGTGGGTISFALTAGNQSNTADGGIAVVEQAETGESITANYSSIPVSVPFSDVQTRSDRTITVCVGTPTNSSFVATFTLQGALRDMDSEYCSIPSDSYTGSTGALLTNVAAPTTAGSHTFAEYKLTNFRYYRLQITYTSGTGTVLARILS